MRSVLSRRPSPAMAVAFIALLAALSGTAVALPGKNTVDSGDIKKGAVKASDIAKNAVRGGKVRNGSLTGADAKDDSITGTDVQETSLGTVPSANTASSAGTANTANSANTANTANSANSANTANDIPDLNFQDLTLKNGWVGNCFGGGAPGIARSAEGVVHFRGEMCRASGTSTNAFAVPSGFAPSQTEWIVVDLCNAHTGRIVVGTDGETFVQDDPAGGGQHACFTSLAGAGYTLPY